jgi:hypothetical protein
MFFLWMGCLPEWVYILKMAGCLQDHDFASHPLEAAVGWVPLQSPAPLLACPAASPGSQPSAADTAGPDLGPRTVGFVGFPLSGATTRKGPRRPATFNVLEGMGPTERNEERGELSTGAGGFPSFTINHYMFPV